MSAASATAAALTLKDHSSAVGQFFGSVRVPASFLVGASFGGLFALPLKSQGRHDTQLEKKFRVAYHLCITSCFFLSVNVVFMSTVSLTKLLNGGFDPIAYSGYRLLNREFHYEFVMTRWTFFMSLFSFLIAVTNRILLEYKLFSGENQDLTKPRRKLVGISVCLVMSSLILHMLSFVNETLFCWNNLMEMTWDLLKTILNRASIQRPEEPLAILLGAVGLAYAIYAMIP